MMGVALIRSVMSLIGFSLGLVLSVGCGSSDKNNHPNASAGATASGGSDAGSSDAAVPKVAKEQIGDNVFDESQVQSYYLTFSDAEYAKLMDFSTLLLNPYTVNKDRYVEAALRFGDTELPSIAVRIDGNYSIWGCVDFATGKRVVRVDSDFGNIDVCQRFSLKLDLNRYDDSVRLDGLKKLNLRAMAPDPSKLRERLAYSLFRDMDIQAPRVAHARVYINGEYQGLWAAVEEVDGRFTANQFPDGDGNLYKEIWPQSDVTDADAQNALKTNQDTATLDVSDFMAFKDAVATSTEANFATQMAAYIDFDYLARYIVVDRAITNFDGIMAFGFGTGWGPANHNYYWYDAGGKFMLIPWDLDKTFWYPEPNFWSDNAPNGKNIVPNWNVTTNSCNGYTCNFDCVTVNNGVTTPCPYSLREIDCDPFLKLLRGEIYDRQKAIADAFITGPFSEPSVTAKLDAWQSQIADAISEDPLVDHAQWQSSIDELRANLPTLQDNLSLLMSGLIAE